MSDIKINMRQKMHVPKSKIGLSLLVIYFVFVLAVFIKTWNCEPHGQYLAPLGCVPRFLPAYPWMFLPGFDIDTYWLYYTPNILILYFIGFYIEKIVKKSR